MNNWSEKYYVTLTKFQHKENNKWFKKMLKSLPERTLLKVPNLGGRFFNKEGQEVDRHGNPIQKFDYIFMDLVS